MRVHLALRPERDRDGGVEVRSAETADGAKSDQAAGPGEQQAGEQQPGRGARQNSGERAVRAEVEEDGGQAACEQQGRAEVFTQPRNPVPTRLRGAERGSREQISMPAQGCLGSQDVIGSRPAGAWSDATQPSRALAAMRMCPVMGATPSCYRRVTQGDAAMFVANADSVRTG